MRRLWILLFLPVLFLAACQSDDDVEPELIIITATRARPDDVALNPTERPTSPPSFPTTTPFPSDTATLPVSPTPQIVVTSTLSLEQLPGFPTSTPSATIEGVASPTRFLSPTPSNTPAPFPTATSPGITASPAVNPSNDVPATQAIAPTTQVNSVPGPQPTVGFEIAGNPAGANVEYPAAISGLAPRPEELPIINVQTLGMQLHPFVSQDEWRNALGLTKQLNMAWIKVQIPWEVAEPERGQFSDLYLHTVELVQRAHLEGFKVLVSVNRAPYWARPQDADLTHGGPPSDPNAYAQFITKLITDIQPQFIDAVEIWNEPNLIREWASVPMDGATYMRYFEPAYHAAKAADPQIIVVTAGLAPVGDIPDNARDDRQFLNEMYAAGLNNFPDARIGVHPYGWANPPDERCCSEEGSWQDAPQFFMLDTIEDYHEIAVEHGDTDRQFWLTEFGWGTYRGINRDSQDAQPPESAEFFNLVSLEQQARYILRAIEIFQQPPYSNYVELAFLWNMNYANIPDAVDKRIEQAGYSLLDAAGRPRLAFWYLLNTRKIR